MKIRWTRRTLRVRLDDLETAALAQGRTLEESVRFPGGAWSVQLGVSREAALGMRDGVLWVALDAAELSRLLDPASDGIEREGRPRLMVEKDLLPQHGGGA